MVSILLESINVCQNVYLQIVEAKNNKQAKMFAKMIS